MLYRGELFSYSLTAFYRKVYTIIYFVVYYVHQTETRKNMANKKIQISVSIDEELKERVQHKLESTGGKVSTLISALLKDFLAEGRGFYPVWNSNRELDQNQKAQLFIEAQPVDKLWQRADLSKVVANKIKRHENSVEVLDGETIDRLASLYDDEVHG